MATEVRALTEADVIPHSAATTLPTTSTLTTRAVVHFYAPSFSERSTATSGEIQDPFRAAARKLEALAWLPKGWDGSHAPEVSGKAISVGRPLLDVVKRWRMGVPNVAPTVVGGVQFEWRAAGGWEFSIDIDAAGTALLFFANADSGELWEGEAGAVPESSSEVFRRLIAAAEV